MGNDLTKSIGSKNLSSLIPTEEPKEEKKTTKASTSTRAKKKPVAPKPEKKTNKTTVTTFRINNDNLEAIKAVAFWERKKIQDVLNEALETYLKTISANELKKAKIEYKKRNP